MKRMILATILLLTLGKGIAWATALTGIFNMYDPSGEPLFPPGLEFSISGDFDWSTGTMFVEPFDVFSSPLTADIEVLGEGTHTRDDGCGGSITATVGPGQVGAYIIFHWGYHVIPALMVWDVATQGDASIFTITDSDGDGIPGHRLTCSDFIGNSPVFNFTVAEPGPGIGVSVEVEGGNTQECSAPGGSTVTLTANVSLFGGAELGSVDWMIDGEVVGSGQTISPFLSLGSHVVQVAATTSTGETSSDTTSVHVVDTTPPDLVASFVDRRSGQEVTSIDRPNVHRIVTRLEASDVCDPHPSTEATVGFPVVDGLRLKIQGKRGRVTLTTSRLELTATARDESSNTTTAKKTLTILP